MDLTLVRIQTMTYSMILQDHTHAHAARTHRFCVEYQEKTVILGERNLKTAIVDRFKVYPVISLDVFKETENIQGRVIDFPVEIKKRCPK